MEWLKSWKEFFTTAAGASATLVGLVIVAVSVNVQRILEHPQLPSRSGATVAALVLILVSSLAELIPQPIKALAIEIFTFPSTLRALLDSMGDSGHLHPFRHQ